MGKNTINSVRVGVFVFIALALLIVSIYFIGKKQMLFHNTFEISGVFKDVNGLRTGNNVRFGGINVGTIEDVKIISDSSVQVDMVIDEEVRKFIKKDAQAIIGSDGLMGSQIMIIMPGTNGEKEINDKDFIKTVEPINMASIMSSLKNTTENAMFITDDLAVIMDNIRSGRGAIGKLLMDKGTERELDQSLNNIKQGTGGFKQNMDAAKHSFLLRGFINDKEKEKEKEKKKQEKKRKKAKKKKMEEEEENN